VAITDGRSHPSSASEAEYHLAIFDDDRDLAAAFAVLQHPLQIGRILLDVDVLERDMPPFIVLTGGCGVGSRVLAEDQHAYNLWFVHHRSSLAPVIPHS
jgi:hypothetical protein